MSYHAVERQDEAALGIGLGGRAVAAVAARLQVREAREGVVEHRRRLRRRLPAQQGRFRSQYMATKWLNAVIVLTLISGSCICEHSRAQGDCPEPHTEGCDKHSRAEGNPYSLGFRV